MILCVLGSQHRILAIIPFFHIYGLNAVLNGAISRGYHVITLPKFEPDTLVAALKEYQARKIIQCDE